MRLPFVGLMLGSRSRLPSAFGDFLRLGRLALIRRVDQSQPVRRGTRLAIVNSSNHAAFWNGRAVLDAGI